MVQGLCALQPVEANISTQVKVGTGLLSRSCPLYYFVSFSFIAPLKCTQAKKIQKELSCAVLARVDRAEAAVHVSSADLGSGGPAGLTERGTCVKLVFLW